MECPPYTDPPPPYSPPKPPQILPGEQPPPYDEINHNISEANADENRNQIRGGDSGHSAHGGTAGQESDLTQWRRTTTRSHADVENAATGQSGVIHRIPEVGQQQSVNGNLRAAITLPAYASTDVVEGFGVVISPGSEVVCYSSTGWNTWLDAGQDSGRMQTEPKHQRSPCGNNFSNSARADSSRAHSLPTTTAFQRFSSIFRRDSWRVKNWRQQGRPASDYSATSHYATVPRNEQSPRSGFGRSRPHSRDKNMSRPACSGFPDTLCLSYDPEQGAYTLGAASPSTSSSNSTNSSEHYDQNATISSTTTCTTSGASTNGNSSASPPGGSSLMVDDYLTSPLHRQLFHDDLRRHLPPLQLSDVHETVPESAEDSSYIFSPKSVTSEADPAFASQGTSNSDQNVQTMIRHPTVEGMYARDTALSTFMTSASPVPADHLSSSHQQQPLVSFIRSHPTPSTMTFGDSLIQSNSHQRLATAEHCPQMLTHSSLQACPKYFPAVSHWSSGLTTQEICSSPGMTDHFLASVQEFASPCQAVSKYSGLCEPTIAMVLVNTSASSPLGLPSATSIGQMPASQPSSSPSTAGTGVLRRSQSGASQASMFSVCSETGEKRLRDSESFDSNARVISADSCYPEHHSMSRLRPSHDHGSQNVVDTRSLTPVDVPAVCMTQFAPGNSCSHGDAFDGKCQLNCDLHLLYSQNDVTMPVAGDDPFSRRLVVSEAMSSSTPASQSSNIASSLTCDNTFTCQIGRHHDEDSCTNSNYNFNTFVDTDKSLAVKDVPSLCDNDRMSQSVNIPPLSPFVTAQSGRMPSPVVLKHTLPTVPDPGSLSKSGKPHEVLKKLKKKRTKDRCLSSPQFTNVSKHNPSSPKHPHVKTCEWNKEAGPLHKPDKDKEAGPLHKLDKDKEAGPLQRPDKDKEAAAVRLPRLGDKKYRGHLGVSKQHVRMCDPVGSGKIMSRSAGDTQTMYGNADVYRSVGCEGLDPALTYQHQAFSLWSHQGYPGGSCDHNMNAGTALNDLNQPPSYLKIQPDHSSPGHSVGGRDGHAFGKGDVRKKGTHKRQLSAGHIPSPSRCKSRPKSLVAQDVPVNEKRLEVTLPRPSLTTGDFGLVGKGARSGFGHDLNFDDQSGVAGFHLLETDFPNRKASPGQDSHTQPGPGPTRKLSRGDANCESSSAANKGANVSCGYQSGSRSGLSSELSFTSRPTLANGHNKKRQSLPAGLTGTSSFGIQDRTSTAVGTAARPRYGEGEGHLHVGQVRGERRSDRPAFVDDYVEATSYV